MIFAWMVALMRDDEPTGHIAPARSPRPARNTADRRPRQGWHGEYG